MKPGWFQVALVVFLLALPAGFGQASVSGKGTPSAVFPAPTLAVAPVPEGGVITHDFAVRNDGGAELEIRDVKTT